MTVIPAAATVAALALAVTAGSLARAQDPPPPRSLGDLFTDKDAVYLRPGAAETLRDALGRATPVGGCPGVARFTVVVPKGDELFQQALGGARRDVVKDALRNEAGRFEADFEVRDDVNEVRAEYHGSDRQPPRLDTESTPRKGTKVKAGDRIRVKMTARDQATPRQSGVRAIELVADAGGRVYREEYPRPAPPCGSANPVPVLTVIYTVPADPPPVVRLRAIATDHAGNRDTDVGEFPTGDWYGRATWSFHQREDPAIPPNANRSETKFDGQADLALHHDGRGGLAGTLLGSQKVDTMWWGYPHGNGEVCRGSAPVTPVRARVTGSLAPGTGAVSIQLADVEASIQPTWSGGGPTLRCTPLPPIDNALTLSGVVRGLQPVGDGTYRSEFHTSQGLFDTRWTVTLRPAGR